MKLLNKRIISLLLALVMVCGIMPMAAFAAEEAKSVCDHTYKNGSCTGCGEKEVSNSHQTENFRWEISNGKLTSITDANFSSNAATALGGSITNGVISSGRYQLAKPLSLLHDQPWSVEWRGSGNWTGMLLATTPDAYDVGLPYFFKTGTDSGLVAFGHKYTQVDNYGRSLNPLGLDYTQSHTYRLENRIHQDGSNMVYLLVDNVEIGPMNCFYIGGSNDQNQTVDWLTGKDFSMSALGTTSHPINGLKLEYLQVMAGDHSHSYVAVVTTPTCTEQGYTTYTCNCGASYVDDHVDAVWHNNENGSCSMCGCAMARITRDDITPSVGTVNSLDGTVNTTITTGWYWDIPIPEGAKQIRYMTFKTAASWGSAFLNGSTYISGVCETIEGYKWVTMDIPEGATIFRHGYLSDARAEQNGRPQFQYVEFSNAKQDISQYMPRPATGCHSFSVNVNIAPAMGDPDGNIVGTDYGYIMLPTNYTSYGEPTRLIIVCHGAGGKRSTYQSDSWKADQNTFWTDMGYAIMDMAACPKPLTSDDRAIHYGNPTVVDCYKAGFDYVMENFNLKQDGIYVIGTSMGGLSSFQIVQSGKFPVIAQVGFCPAIDLFKQAYCVKWGSAERDYQKSHISSYFGFEGAPASFTNTFPTDAEIELYKKNFEKTVNYSPILRNVVDGDIATIFDVIPTSAAGTDAAEAAIYEKFTATHPCPVMIIHSMDDAVVPYRYSQYFADMLKRSGQDASLYTINGVNHMAWQYGKNCTLQGLNGPITIKESQYEAYKFFEKFEKHEEHQPWVDPAVKATCSTAGLTKGKHCASCGEILVKQNVIPTTNEHTYENGVCTGCGATQPGPVITQQPESVEQEIGKKFAITVKAEGEGLAYQWYVKESGAKAFKVSSNKTSSYAYTMQTYMHNRQVYCVITDANGDSVQTETATISRPPQALRIIEQPQDAQQEIGQKFSISPKVEGEGLTYQWYVKESGAKAFKVSSVKGSAYALTMQKYMIGRQVYCVITDKYGNSVTTDVATISLPPVELKILEQPTDVYASKGEKFSISPKVQGEGLTYQWYYKEGYMKDFKPSSNKTSAYAYSMQTYMNERSVYCVITDKYGNQVQTEVVTIHLEK